MTTINWAQCAITLIALLSAPPSYADKSHNPCSIQPMMMEPHQRAIILWNGKTERLVLSTDLMQSFGGKHIEWIPFPSAPTEVAIQNFTLFSKFVSFAKNYGFDTGSIGTFAPYGTMGADLYTAAFQNDADFDSYFDDRLREECGGRSDASVKLVAHTYIKEGNPAFVFDTIDADEQIRSFPPIAYQFDSSRLYYPLKDSSVNQDGSTQIDLILISPQPLYMAGIGVPIIVNGAAISLVDLDAAVPELHAKNLLNSAILSMQHVRISSELRSLTTDFYADMNEGAH